MSSSAQKPAVKVAGFPPTVRPPLPQPHWFLSRSTVRGRGGLQREIGKQYLSKMLWIMIRKYNLSYVTLILSSVPAPSVSLCHGGGWSRKINAWYLYTLMVYL
jgi:hypothetical protein